MMKTRNTQYVILVDINIRKLDNIIRNNLYYLKAIEILHIITIKSRCLSLVFTVNLIVEIK